MPNFKKYSYDQTAMVVIDFIQQLRPNTFEFTLHHLIEEHIDLSAFYDKFNNDKGGRSAYDPAILLKIILFAYSKGVRSSRDIQWECENNIIFKALSCDTVPHFTSIANFISSYPDAIESVFEQVLLVCDEQGLLGNELIAIDGCKMPSNAAKEHSGTLHGKRHQDTVKGLKKVIAASEFTFNTQKKACRCPAGNTMWLKNDIEEASGKIKLFFEGKLTDCRHCPLKHECMRNPASADTREGHGRQVSITVNGRRSATYWMRRRVDSQLGKQIYGHRMSVVEPVFGNIGTNKGLNRFSLRGKEKVEGQWKLYSLVHNIEKLANYSSIGL